MDTIEQFCQELKQFLSDINASGFENMPADTIEKLEKIGSAAATLGLKIGKGLIDNLLSVLKSFQAGTADERSVSVRFTALDFYEKNLLGNGGENDVEEL
ncbi:MAG: hypothetical protein LBP93_03420 [Treponema sp.]|jgi:hypothetical protein|nr:hypothetical protein [Treponema sp.]